MMKPRAGDIHIFCSKLSQSNLKWLLKIPCDISATLSTGQGQGQVTKGHQNQKFFSGKRHMIYGHFCM